MKKFFVTLILLLSLCLTGCFKTSVSPNEGSVTFTLDNDFKSVLSVSELPEFEFKFDGNLNTVINNTKSYIKVFSNNEDIILSDALNKLFDQYKDRIFIQKNGSEKVSTTLFSTLDEFGNVKNVKYTPDDKKIYEETAYISLENGLKLSVDYRRFIYNGKNMYSWKYDSSLTMFLYYPMMAIENGLKNKIVLITLPNCITFKVGPTLLLKSILNEKTYVDKEDSVYYTFNYFDNPNKEEDEQDKKMSKKKDDHELTEEEIKVIKEHQKYVIDYYVNDHNAVYDSTNKTLTYTYLGNKFRVDLFDNYFRMHYIAE